MTSTDVPSDIFSSDPANLPQLDSQDYIASFSDEIEALHAQETEALIVKNRAGIVVQHRSWKVADVFRSEPNETITTSPMPYMGSSPPLTPSPKKKRKFSELALGDGLRPKDSAPKAKRAYYGISIHQLLEDATHEEGLPKATIELPTPPAEQPTKKPSLLWTEKYRARKFTDLIGDERTHRSVMYWLKRWDEIVYPGTARPRPKAKPGAEHAADERPHRKILMLTGPPGLGKTTLAHVCAKQAGYEVQEINASDERSSNVVKGRIRDMVGTENVKGVDTKTINGKVRKAGKPVCVIVDEVDGVVSGSGGSGEGGFVKALIDLVMLDQKNSTALGTLKQGPAKGKRKGDRFRLLRPLVLICNDVYHPSLRPLRQSTMAEVIHVRKPPLATIVNRMHTIFEKEGVPCESDGVRRLCEATWGVSNRKEDKSGSGAGEGDMRGIMVVGEWVAGKLRAMNDATGSARLTRRWIEDNILHDLTHDGGAARGLGRGGPKDIVERVFREGAGFPKSSAITTPQHQVGHGGGAKTVTGVAEALKKTATERLRELIDTHGDSDRIMTDCFSAYPDHQFQDDTLLSKPDAAYDWLYFHDALSSAVFSSNEWELAPYLSQPVLAFHHLFASPARSWGPTADKDQEEAPPHPFAGPQASWAAHEAQKQNVSLIQSLQSSLSLDLTRLFSSTSDISTDLLPYLLRMLSPPVNPIIVGGSGSDKGTASVRKASEQTLVAGAVQAMGASGVRFERSKVDAGDGGASWGAATSWIYRMEPALDTLGTFETGGKAFGEGAGKTRYAVRQVLEQEWKKEDLKRAEAARMARFSGGETEEMRRNRAAVPVEVALPAERKSKVIAAETRDFFGRVVTGSRKEVQATKRKKEDEDRVWVSFHEGFSNAVRKPVTLAELMRDL